MKGTVSAQKALQGSETETRELLGGTEENSLSPGDGSLIFPPVQINDFFYKKDTEKNELVARPTFERKSTIVKEDFGGNLLRNL